MVESRWNEYDGYANIEMKQTEAMADQRTPLMRLHAEKWKSNNLILLFYYFLKKEEMNDKLVF